jgi:hypothetical protein
MSQFYDGGCVFFSNQFSTDFSDVLRKSVPTFTRSSQTNEPAPPTTDIF